MSLTACSSGSVTREWQRKMAVEAKLSLLQGGKSRMHGDGVRKFHVYVMFWDFGNLKQCCDIKTCILIYRCLE